MNQKITGAILALVLVGSVAYLGLSFLSNGETGISGLVTGIFASETEEDPVQNGEEDNGEQNGELDSDVVIYYFWGDGCPVCAQQEPMLDQWEEEYSEEELQIKRFEIYYDEENQELFQEMASEYGMGRLAVPATFIGQEDWLGYNEEMGQEMENKLEECLDTDACINPAEKLD